MKLMQYITTDHSGDAHGRDAALSRGPSRTHAHGQSGAEISKAHLCSCNSERALRRPSELHPREKGDWGRREPPPRAAGEGRAREHVKACCCAGEVLPRNFTNRHQPHRSRCPADAALPQRVWVKKGARRAAPLHTPSLEQIHNSAKIHAIDWIAWSALIRTSS